MSLGIAFKGFEGIVLAADSRVTLNAESRQPNRTILIPAFYDNATKLLQFQQQPFIGVITYGIGSIGQQTQRTAHSFLPELENELQEKDVERLSVEDFAAHLSDFFMRQWKDLMPPNLTAN